MHYLWSNNIELMEDQYSMPSSRCNAYTSLGRRPFIMGKGEEFILISHAVH